VLDALFPSEPPETPLHGDKLRGGVWRWDADSGCEQRSTQTSCVVTEAYVVRRNYRVVRANDGAVRGRSVVSLGLAGFAEAGQFGVDVVLQRLDRGGEFVEFGGAQQAFGP
jgi:hypothetical protein